MKIYNSFLELVGNTPLLRLNNIERENALSAQILAKLEYLNPAGSVKDRAALNMIKDAEEKGVLKAGATIIEPTSGNTGIGLAAVAVPRGYKVILTMPETMSVERRAVLKAYGAQLVLTDGKKGMAGAIEKAEALSREIENSVIMGQFTNPANAQAHYKSTGPEIWSDTDGKVDVFVAGIGTGGTITGIARYLKEKNPKIKIIGVEPASSPFLTRGEVGSHGLMGIGAGFKPEILDLSLIDEVVTVTEEDAYSAGRELAKCEGILCGITSGAALHAAKLLAKTAKGKNIVVLLPDTGDRYLSTPMFE